MRRDAVVIDIETKSDPRVCLDTEWLTELHEGIEAPSNYKDPLEIAAYKDERFRELRAKFALSAATGRIVAIGWALLDSAAAPIVVAAAQPDLEGEMAMLESFVIALPWTAKPVLAGHCIRDFDLPFITARAAICEVELPPWWPHPRDYRNVIDTVDVMGRGHLAGWLRAFGLPPKTGKGSDVETMNPEEILNYCRNDVHVERLLLRRLAESNAFPALRITT